MDCERILFSVHALRRMFERSISKEEAIEVIEGGELILEYPHDQPYSSVVLLGKAAGRHMHVVVAQDDATGTCVVITVYVPDPAVWTPDFRTRRS